MQYEISVQILWTTLLVLLFSTIVLLLGSMYMRYRNRIIERKVQAYTNKFYPIILDYLENGKDEDEILKHFTGKGIEYAVFEKVVIELLDQLSGDDADKIRQLLYLDPIFEHHVRQLDSGSKVTLVKACNYFGYVRLVNFRVIRVLRYLVNDSNRLLAFSAASALMASKNIEDRKYALERISMRKRISEMAVLELLHKFQSKSKKETRHNEEAEALKWVVNLKDIPSDNLALLVLGISEMGYFQLTELFYKYLKSRLMRWNHVEVKKALIRSQGYFLNWEASEYIRNLLDAPNPEIVKASAEVLSIMKGEENEQKLLSKITGEDENEDFVILSAMFSEGYDDSFILEKVQHVNKEYLGSLIEIIKYDQGLIRHEH